MSSTGRRTSAASPECDVGFLRMKLQVRPDRWNPINSVMFRNSICENGIDMENISWKGKKAVHFRNSKGNKTIHFHAYGHNGRRMQRKEVK